jgi:uncharacterized protein
VRLSLHGIFIKQMKVNHQFLINHKTTTVCVFFAIFSLLLLKANACDNNYEPNNAGEKKTTSLLWEISGNGLSKPSYLYGTIHLIDKKDFYVRPLIDSMLVNAGQVVFEIKLDDMAALMSIQSMMNLPEGKTIKGMMNATDYAALKKYFSDSLHTDIETMNDQKPFALIQKVTESYIKGDQESFELHFLMECMNHQKTILGLETVADQMAVFDTIPYEEQIGWLVEWADSSSKYDDIFDRLITFYKEENLDSIAKCMNESSPELMKYADEFIYDRNRKWIPEIKEMIKDKTTFIAVGAGHLPGENGVIALLRKEGYTVKPI